MRVRARSILAVALLVLILPLAGAEVGVRFERHVDRLVASPTPAGGIVILGDASEWRLDVPEGVVVCIDARENGAAPFTLSARDGTRTISSALPTLAQSLVVQGPDTWTVRADPAFGASVHLTVDFRGAFVDCGNAAASFTITDLVSSAPCATEAGACLP